MVGINVLDSNSKTVFYEIVSSVCVGVSVAPMARNGGEWEVVSVYIIVPIDYTTYLDLPIGGNSNLQLDFRRYLFGKA